MAAPPLEDRVRAHSDFFDKLVELIPARYYVPEEQNPDWSKFNKTKSAKAAAKLEAKENSKKALRAKLQPGAQSTLEKIKSKARGDSGAAGGDASALDASEDEANESDFEDDVSDEDKELEDASDASEDEDEEDEAPAAGPKPPETPRGAADHRQRMVRGPCRRQPPGGAPRAAAGKDRGESRGAQGGGEPGEGGEGEGVARGEEEDEGGAKAEGKADAAPGARTAWTRRNRNGVASPSRTTPSRTRTPPTCSSDASRWEGRWAAPRRRSARRRRNFC